MPKKEDALNCNDALVMEHQRHLRALTVATEGREPTDAELNDMRAMLSVTGVAPVSDSVMRRCEQQAGRKDAAIRVWGKRV